MKICCIYRPPRQHVLKWREIFHQTTLHPSSEASRDKPQSLLNQWRQYTSDRNIWPATCFLDISRFLVALLNGSQPVSAIPKAIGATRDLSDMFNPLQPDAIVCEPKASHYLTWATISFFGQYSANEASPPFWYLLCNGRYCRLNNISF